MVNKEQSSFVWPNLFIVGAAKSGTTTLFEYLKGHEQVFMSPIKEPHFFSNIAKNKETHIYDRWTNWITSEVEYCQLFENATGYPIIGEASTSYLWASGTPERIRSRVPDAWIIMLLRDPVDRAYSHYLMDVRSNWQQLPFYEALLEDFHSERKGWHISRLYVELGLYYQQILPYWQAFDRNKLLILMLDEMQTRPDQTLQKVAAFLNIDYKGFQNVDSASSFNPYLAPTKSLQFIKDHPQLGLIISKSLPLSLRAAVRNRYFMRPSTKPPIDPRAVSFLSKIYTPEIEALEGLLGHNLPSLKGNL